MFYVVTFLAGVGAGYFAKNWLGQEMGFIAQDMAKAAEKAKAKTGL